MNNNQEYLLAAIKTAMRIYPEKRIGEIILNSCGGKNFFSESNSAYLMLFYLSDEDLAKKILDYCKKNHPAR